MAEPLSPAQIDRKRAGDLVFMALVKDASKESLEEMLVLLRSCSGPTLTVMWRIVAVERQLAKRFPQG